MELKTIAHFENGGVKEIYTGYIEWISEDEFILHYRFDGQNRKIWGKKDYWVII